jgi:hypothetical protein
MTLRREVMEDLINKLFEQLDTIGKIKLLSVGKNSIFPETSLLLKTEEEVTTEFDIWWDSLSNKEKFLTIYGAWDERSETERRRESKQPYYQ